jgi:hypothetical protein
MAQPPNLINATVINGKSDVLTFKGADETKPLIIKENSVNSGKVYKINLLKLTKMPLPAGSSAPGGYLEFYLDVPGLTVATLKSNEKLIWKKKYAEIDSTNLRAGVDFIISRESVVYLQEGQTLYLLKNGLNPSGTTPIHFSITVAYEEIS